MVILKDVAMPHDLCVHFACALGGALLVSCICRPLVAWLKILGGRWCQALAETLVEEFDDVEAKQVVRGYWGTAQIARLSCLCHFG